jgi:hypothetical protein
MSSLSASPLPPLYAKWFDELLGGEIPPETRATCHDCAMCESGDAHQQPGSQLFNPQVKCCSYLPKLHNFLTGMILLDEDPGMARGRLSVEARMQAGLAVTPLGLEQNPRQKLVYDQIEMSAFGRAQSLRCPHYIDQQGGLCGVWKYRNSTCSTWFCKYVRGAKGRQFWEAARLLLLAIEDDLARWCAMELEIGDEALELLLQPRIADGRRNLTPEELDDRVDSARQGRIWGAWYRREREFYQACADLVARLSWPEVLAVCGSEVRARARLTYRAYRLLVDNEIPTRLRLGSFTVMEVGIDFFRLHHPGVGMDSLTLSAKVMRLLPYFDGRPRTEILAQIEAQEHLRFTDDLLRRLLDFKILLSAED